MYFKPDDRLKNLSASVCPDLTTELDTVYSTDYTGDTISGTKFKISCPDGKFFNGSLKLDQSGWTEVGPIDNNVECKRNYAIGENAWQWHGDNSFTLTEPKECIGTSMSCFLS